MLRRTAQPADSRFASRRHGEREHGSDLDVLWLFWRSDGHADRKRQQGAERKIYGWQRSEQNDFQPDDHQRPGGCDFRTCGRVCQWHAENRWACFVMQAAAYSELSPLDLMKLCVWREARGEGILGKRGVAQVIQNRAN